jgi:hypothetical protein
MGFENPSLEFSEVIPPVRVTVDGARNSRLSRGQNVENDVKVTVSSSST